MSATELESVEGMRSEPNPVVLPMRCGKMRLCLLGIGVLSVRFCKAALIDSAIFCAGDILVTNLSTSLESIYDMLRNDYDMQKKGIHFLNLLDMKY